MSGFAEVLAADRRLVILRTLSEAPGYQLNEMVLRTAVQALGHTAGRDVIRGDVAWLQEQLLVRADEINVPTSGKLWVVHLTIAGGEVADGRSHPGVARRWPE